MNVRVNLRHVLGAGAVLFAVAALYMSLLFDRRQDELSKASRYDLSWTAAQTVVEIVAARTGDRGLCRIPRADLGSGSANALRLFW